VAGSTEQRERVLAESPKPRRDKEEAASAESLKPTSNDVLTNSVMLLIVAAEVPEKNKNKNENKNENENELADGIVSGVTQECPVVAGVSSSATNERMVLADCVGGVAMMSSGDQNVLLAGKVASGVGLMCLVDQNVLLVGKVVSDVGLMCSVNQVVVAGTSRSSDMHTPDVFGGVSGVLKESEVNSVGDEKAGKMAVFGNGSIKSVNDYEWYDSDSGDIGIELGECEQGGVSEFEFLLAIPTRLNRVPA